MPEDVPEPSHAATEVSKVGSPLLTREEAAEYLRQKVSWVRDHAKEIPHIKVGRRVFYTAELLDGYLASKTMTPVPQPRPAAARSGRSRSTRRAR
jgi:excisionase family DNA binding protein